MTDSSAGVVTQTSRVDATVVTPSIATGTVKHVPRASVWRSIEQTSFVARSPTYAKPSPMATELGPAIRFWPCHSRSAVLKPSTRRKVLVATSRTSTLPVTPTGTHTRGAPCAADWYAM